MGLHRRKNGVDGSICLRAFPKENPTHTHYMLSLWWLHLLYGLVNYVILPGAIGQVLLMTNNTMTLGYTYSKLRLKNLLDIFYKLAHNRRIIA